ncbi:MAG: M13 family peptidase, partial [Bacteroidota bacterium]
MNINQQGIGAIKAELDQIAAIKDPISVAKACAMVHITSGSPMFGMYVGQDDKISSKHAVFVYQGGLSLPDRSFYLDNDSRSTSIRKDFVSHLSRMFMNLGQDSTSASKTANDVMALEIAIAKASRKKEDTRDPHKNYNKMPMAQLAKSTPNFDWSTFMSEIGLRSADTVIVGQPEFLTALNNLVKQTPLPTWSSYLQYHFVKGLAPYLDDKTYAEHFSFYSTTMRGISEMKPRWKRVVDQTNSSLGELIGQVYVDEYLPKGTKEKLQQIGNDIKVVYAERIKQLDWMSDVTTEKALVKLNG